jgi:twitching motility protein PilT
MRFRVNAFYEKGMVSAAIRMMHVEMPTFEKLGLPVDEIKKIFDMKSGIILISGPTGAGKSTTVASIINFINQTKKQHIITIEDPIEFLYRDRKSIISQREVGVDTPSFYSALYEAIQQDPDVIVVGEVKDSQTVELVNVAAEAGKLIICMVRATNSVQAIERFLSLYTGRDQHYFRHIFASNFKGISVRTCKADKADSMPIFEVIWSDSDMRSLIFKTKYGQLILLYKGHHEGILSFSDSLNELVKSGKLTPEEALKHKVLLLLKWMY